MRSLRLREADRAPANAGARLRLRAEVRHSCADRNPSRPPRRIAASLRHCAPRYGVSASPWIVPPRDGAPTSLWSCASATAYRHRSGAVPPRRRIGIGLVPRPPRQRFDPALGVTTFALTPRSGAVPPLGTTTLALGPRPSLWRRAPGSGRFSRRDAATRAALGTTTFALALCPPLWGPRPLPWAALRRSAPPALGGARCEKPSVLVAGGQNRRFFAVSEVGNGRFCRLFA